MADWEHVAKFLEGVDTWNTWRSENPAVHPNLRGANLGWTEMQGANLSNVDLTAASLFKAGLSRADFRGANLQRADLRRCDLRKVMLEGANLDLTDISGANLDGAEVELADLTSTRSKSPVSFKPDPVDLARLLSGVEPWNAWRRRNLDYAPQLSGAGLAGLNLAGADLSRANLVAANLSNANLANTMLVRADLERANLSGCDAESAYLELAQMAEANLSGSKLVGAYLDSARMYKVNMSRVSARGVWLGSSALNGANLHLADLTGAYLFGASLNNACLSEANLTETGLDRCSLVQTDLRRANLTGASVYGICAWDVLTEGASQFNLRVTEADEVPLRVDDLELAQFIHMLLKRQKLRNALTTLGEKVVLILGRFTERKELLDRMANRLREMGYLPMIFDFERPTDRDLTETVKILAGLSRFVIADITNPRSVPLELMATVPDYMVPFVTILERGQPAFGMFGDLPGKYHWALKLLEYKDADSLMKTFESKVVGPALEKVDEVRKLKAAPPGIRSAED